MSITNIPSDMLAKPTEEGIRESRLQLRAAEIQWGKAKTPAGRRNAAIDSLEGLITLAREVFGPDYTHVATELLIALEDLKCGTDNDIFAPARRSTGGRPPTSGAEHSLLAAASALTNYKRNGRGSLEERLSMVARQFRIDVETLRNFRKKVASKNPPSRAASLLYRSTLQALRDHDISVDEAMVLVARGMRIGSMLK